jgi:hypothetical protein
MPRDGDTNMRLSLALLRTYTVFNLTMRLNLENLADCKEGF